MKLVAKIFAGTSARDGCAVMLCTEDGEPLPGQVEATLRTGAGAMGYVTVMFAVDGRDIRLEPSSSLADDAPHERCGSEHPLPG